MSVSFSSTLLQVMFFVAKASSLYANYSLTAIGQPNSTAVMKGAVPYTPQP
jgi:hypothetical protein